MNRNSPGTTYRRLAAAGILCLSAALGMAFTWPWDTAAQKKQEQKKRPPAVEKRVEQLAKEAAASSKEAPDRSRDRDLRTDMNYSGQLPDGLPGKAELPSIPHFEVPGRDIHISKPKLPDFKAAMPSAASAGPSEYLTAGRAVKTAPPVREQLDEIIKLNESLKVQHRGDAAALQRIASQAEIHKRLLADLEKTRTTRAVAVPPDTSELIRQEKINLIRAEAQQNYDFLSSLKEASAAGKAEK